MQTHLIPSDVKTISKVRASNHYNMYTTCPVLICDGTYQHPSSLAISSLDALLLESFFPSPDVDMIVNGPDD
jgi:hypothetical protein